MGLNAQPLMLDAQCSSRNTAIPSEAKYRYTVSPGILRPMIAVVFPGQGSQKPGMGKELYEVRPQAKQAFERISEATGVDAKALCFNTDEETLRQTQNAQLALYTVSVAAWEALNAHFRGVVRIDAFAGHSVGEYAALTAAGATTIEGGARLVQTRGQIMSEAGKTRPGTMAAVLGLERDQLEKVCDSTEGVVVIANDNCPGQLVISGDLDAVARASEAATAAGAKRVLPLNVSGAFHSPLMDESADRMAEALAKADFQPGEGRVFANVTAQPVVRQGVWPDLLTRQLKSPVRWTETIQNMLNEGIRTFIECGSGDVLSGLIKRIDREAKSYRVQDLESLENTISALRA
jgi:[acyl-carrier-protein] S-malonyltransferase